MSLKSKKTTSYLTSLILIWLFIIMANSGTAFLIDSMESDNLQPDADGNIYSENEDENFIKMFGTNPSTLNRDRPGNANINSTTAKQESELNKIDYSLKVSDPNFFPNDNTLNNDNEELQLENNYEIAYDHSVPTYPSAFYIDRVQSMHPTVISPNTNSAEVPQAEQNKFKQNVESSFILCITSEANNNIACLPVISWNKNSGVFYPVEFRRCMHYFTISSYLHCVHRLYLSILKYSAMYNVGYNKLNSINAVPTKQNKTFDMFKRLPFHAWGGKRFNQEGNEKVQASRVPFNAWGGKRQCNEINYNKDSKELCKKSKAKFHSWGGKRNARKANAF